jgi:hypothetical protein
MRTRRTMTLLVGAMAMVVATTTPAVGHHAGISKAEVDFGTCREVVATKTVRTDAVASYLPADVLLPADGAELVIRAAKCRWLKATYGDHGGGTRHPIIIQVGVVADGKHPLPAIDTPPGEDLHALFTVTNSRPLARAARAASHARVYLTDNVRFWMGHGEACGDPVRTVVSVRDDHAPSFSMHGVVGAPGPKCDVATVGPTSWWTVKGDVASSFTYLERRQSLVRSEGQLEVWAARNTRLNRIVGSAHFMTDTVRTGLIRATDRSPDAVIVPHLLGV